MKQSKFNRPINFFGLPAAIAGGAALSFVGGMMQNDANSAQSSRQMAFQREMSNTAHQREVDDLRLAGLNPILSAGGAGASSPGGASARMENVAANAVNSAVSVSGAVNQTNMQKQQIATMIQQADESQTNEFKLSADTMLAKLQYAEKQLYMQMLEEQVKIAHRKGEIATSTFGNFMAYIKEFTSSVLGGGSLIPSQPKR